jgi:hypothetical protein
LTFNEDEVEAGGDVDRVTVALRVAANDLEPDGVTKLLGVTSSFSARKGEKRQSGSQEVVQPVGLWSYEVGSDEWTLHDGIVALLERLPDDLAVWEQVSALGRIDVFCGLHLNTWNRGFDLPATLLARMAERGIALSVDIYCNGPASDADV